MPPARRVDRPTWARPLATAFVIQLDVGADEESALRGRVKHLDSGAEARFGDVNELLSFLRGMARPTARNSGEYDR